MSFFTRHADLGRLLEGAHHRRVVKFGAPALVRMIGLWRPWSKGREEPIGSKRKVQTALEKERLRLAEIDLTIASVYRALRYGRLPEVKRASVRCDARAFRNGAKSSAMSRELTLFGGKVQLKHPSWEPFDRRVAAGDTDSAPTDAIAALLKEAWKPSRSANPHRSIRISFVWRGIKCHFLFELHAEFLSILVVLDFSTGTATGKAEKALAAVCKRSVRRRASEGSGPPIDAHCDQGCQDELFESVWADLEALVWPTLSANPGALGERFADLRGVILAPIDDQDGAFRGFRPPIKWNAENPTRTTLSAIGGRCQVDHLEKAIESPLNAGFASVLDILTYPRALEDSELSLSAMLIDQTGRDTVPKPGRRALLASTMKPHTIDEPPPRSASRASWPGEDRYLRYVVYADPVNRWQLGRLVYRINRAGLNRIAATMHYDKLNKIGRDLNNVERLLEQSFSDNSKQGNGTHTHDTVEAAGNDVRNVRAALANVFAPPGEGARAREIDGPLEYRVERSRAYVSQWKRVTEALRIDRIPGHQPYNEFVDQRLGAAFDFIDRLGRRYERILHAQADLQRRYTSLESSEATKSIERIQEYGELALVAALLPYYVGYVLAAAFEYFISKQFIWFLAICWGVFYLFYWLGRTREKRLKNRAPLSRSNSFILIQALLAIGAVVCATLGAHQLLGGEVGWHLIFK